MCTFLNFAEGSCNLSESVDMLKRSVFMRYRTLVYIGDPHGGERVAGGDRDQVRSQSIRLHAVDIYS